MKNSGIEWTDHTFNPWVGCTKVSPGCVNCYAEARDQRFYAGAHWGKGAARQRTAASNWAQPLHWNREALENGRCRVFCASLADWLDDEVPIEWLADLLRLIWRTPNLRWQLLTKRPENWCERLGQINNPVTELRSEFGEWLAYWRTGIQAPSNVWIGTSVEDQARANERIPELLKIPARIRFLSVEPMLEAIDLRNICHQTEHDGYASFGNFWDFSCENHCTFRGFEEELVPDPEQSGAEAEKDGTTWVCPECKSDSALVERLDEYPSIHWIICGGESGANRRAFNCDWGRSLRDQCKAAGVPFFFKQVDKVQAIPEDLMVREFPDSKRRDTNSTNFHEGGKTNQEKIEV